MKNYRKEIKAINAARAQYNPLRGITLQKVVGYLEAGERGEYKDLQWLFRMIEKRDAVLRALVRRRAAALLKLEWDIKQIPDDDLPTGSTPAQAEAQALALRTMYDGISNLKVAIKFLALAEFRGYSHLEKSYKENLSTKPDQIDALYPINQWYWCRDGLEGEWMFDPELRGSYRRGEEVEPEGLIIREVSDPVNEIALISFLRKNLSQKDWDGFIEVFGIPDIFFTMPQGLSKDDQDAWTETAAVLSGAGTGGLPAGSDVKAVGGDIRGTQPFKEHLEYQDAMTVLAGTGGKLTMLSEATGIGGGATGAHEDAFDDLAKAEAAEISELLQCCIDAPLLKAKFEGQPPLAYFEIAAKDQEDVTALVDHALKLSQAGINIDVDDLAQRTGYPLTRNEGVPPTEVEPDSPPKKPQLKNRLPKFTLPWSKNQQSKISNRKSSDPTETLKKNSRTAIDQAISLDLRPLAASLADLLDNTDDEQLAEALENWRETTLPELTAAALQNPMLGIAMEEAEVAALFNGYFAEDEK